MSTTKDVPPHELWSTMDPALRKERGDYVEHRWKQLYDLSTSRADAAVNFLMFANSGGAVTTLGFMGAMKTVAPVPGAPVMLGAFLAGIFLVGLLRAIHYYRMTSLSNHWARDVALLFRSQLLWRDLIQRDEERSGSFPLADVVGWLSFICFVGGAVIGYLGMFELGA